MSVVTVLYPKNAASAFDHDYYLRKHIPLVKARWSGMGLDKVELFRGTAAFDGNHPAYELVGLLHFSSLDAMMKALEAHGPEVMGDIPNFTNVQPVIQVSDPVGV